MNPELVLDLTYGPLQMSNVEMWFPVAVYKQEDIISVEENEILKNICLEIEKVTVCGGPDWVGGTYNTLGTFDVSKDPRFELLFKKISTHVHNFAEMHGSYGSYNASYAWFNVSRHGNYQEFHSHNNNVFSAVYYISAPEGSGKLVFEDPKEPDMCGLKKLPEKNLLSFTRVGYTPVERTLIIFRSYLRHLVEPGTNTEPRISVAINFK